jgi:hypothetical protein
MIKHYEATTANKMDKHRAMEGVQTKKHMTFILKQYNQDITHRNKVSQRQHATNFLLLFGRHERCAWHKNFGQNSAEYNRFSVRNSNLCQISQGQIK